MGADNLGAIYDAHYYATGCGQPYQRDAHWLNFFDGIAARMISDIGAGSVLDAGCAMGFLVEQLRRRGVEAYGVDISEHAISLVHDDIKPFCWVGSLTDPLPQRYNLIVTIEVLEHMPRTASEQAIANMCSASDDILFSSSPFDYKEISHFNVNPPEYWAEQFARHGFFRDVDFDASFITPWAVRFRRRNEPIQRLVRDYERKYWPLDRENQDLRQLNLELRRDVSGYMQVAADERMLKEQQAELVQRISRDAKAERELLTRQIRDRERHIAVLRAQVADKDHGLAALTKRNAEFEAIVKQKNQHIAYLEELIQRLQNGRVMQLLTRIQGRLRPQAPAPSVPPPTTPTMPATPLTPSAPVVATDPVAQYAAWIKANEPDRATLGRQREDARRFASQPLMSVIVPVYNPPLAVLRAAIESVLAQTYPNWELCLVDGASPNQAIKPLLAEYAQRDQRIKLQLLDENRNISGNSNAALELTTGAFVVLLDHDDLLAPNLLFEAVNVLNQQPNLDVIYYDEDKVSADGTQRNSPWFKPAAYSPELLLATNYMMHSIIRRSLLVELGGFDSEMNGAQDWDLSLRLSEKTNRIAHIAQVLYHWRQIEGSAARDANAKPWAFAAQERCITAHLQRIGISEPRVEFPSLGRVRVRWPISGALISIIIPTKDKLDVLRPCLTAIFERTSYPNYEIILVDTGSQQPETQAYYATLADRPNLRIVAFSGVFNWGAANNLGAQHARGELLLFLNNDTEPLEADWLDELAGWVERPEIGVVGAKLIRPDGTLQHAGIVMGVAGHGSHVFDGDREGLYGPFGTPEWYRNYQAVTGACLMTSRTVFERLHGFDEIYRIGYSDIEYCLRANQAGYRTIYTPFARVLHHEGASRGFDLPPADVLRATLQMYPLIKGGDPYFSPNLAQMERQPTLSIPGEESLDSRLEYILRGFGLEHEHHYGAFPEDGVRLAPAWPDAFPVRQTDQPLRVLLVSHDLSLSGAPLILCTLGRALHARGFAVQVAAPFAGPLSQRYSAAGIDVLIEPALLNDARMAAVIMAGHDLVLINTIMAWRTVYAAKATGTRSIWWVHETQVGADLIQHEPQIAKAFAAADKLLFPARATAQIYQHFTRPEQVSVVHLGIEALSTQRYTTPFPRLPGTIHVLMVGSFEARKGQDVLLAAYEQLPTDLQQQLHIHLVGRVLDYEYYADLTPRLDRHRNIHVVGEANHGLVQAYLQHADLFVLPSRDEALPIVVLEAMLSGKAIIASQAGGVAEVIDHGVHGLVVPIADPAALATALTQLINDPALRSKLGAAAQARAAGYLTLERFEREIETVFAAALEVQAVG
jgi:glycosyltransferase involved in cell wall biosynthesis/GT2 family glycosyltransferase